MGLSELLNNTFLDFSASKNSVNGTQGIPGIPGMFIMVFKKMHYVGIMREMVFKYTAHSITVEAMLGQCSAMCTPPPMTGHVHSLI